MRNPDEFDAFYKDARARLLLQTYALTGDLPASRAAVRDSFVVAWHHWRKISRLEDPEAWARPHAWAHAQRRHTARLWHREKGLDPEVRATLDALGKLPVTQRKALLLTQLTTVSMADMAREVGLPAPEAERELQTATAQFAVHRDVPTTSIRPLFEGAAPTRRDRRSGRAPRSSAGPAAARRRTHTAVGAVAAVAALVVTGSLVTDAAGVRPTLDRETVAAGAGPRPRPPSTPPRRRHAGRPAGRRDARAAAGGARTSTAAAGRSGTPSDNTAGDGLVLPCQRRGTPTRRAPRPWCARSTPHPPAGRRPRSDAAAASVASRSPRCPEPAGRRPRPSTPTLGWYAGCVDERVQLLSTRRVDRVGDEAMLLVLRDWDRPARDDRGRRGPHRAAHHHDDRPGSRARGPRPRRGSRRLLAHRRRRPVPPARRRAPARGAPAPRSAAPLPVGEVPGMLGEVDLPPVTGVDRPLGRHPAAPGDRPTWPPPAATGPTSRAAPMTNNLTRSFLIPGAELPDQFGLTETVGLAARAAARRAFVERGPDADGRLPGPGPRHRGHRDAAGPTTAGPTSASGGFAREISDESSVDLPDGHRPQRHRRGPGRLRPGRRGDDGGPSAFVALVTRALDRLAAMPPPRKG